MYTLHKSALFVRQWQGYAQDYKDRAGTHIAERFVTAVEEALLFVAQSPLSCPLYDTSKDKDLQRHIFRRWNVHTFPHAVFFRMENTHVFVELLYAQKMDITTRMTTDTLQ